MLEAPYTHDAGLLRHRLAIYHGGSLTRTPGDTPAKTPTLAATVWGRIEPLTGREIEFAKQIDPRITHRITIRYYASLNVRYWFTNDGRKFEIIHIRNIDDRNTRMEVMCMERIKNTLQGQG